MSQVTALQIRDNYRISGRVRQLIEAHRNDSQTHEIEVAGFKFSVHPGVFDPSKGSLSIHMVEYLDVKPGQEALDLGTGCGLYAVIMAKKGAVVTATDADDAALDCAAHNFIMNGLRFKYRTDFRKVSRFDTGPKGMYLLKSDVFDRVPNKKFDLIVTNPPVVNSGFYGKRMEDLDSIERALIDDGTFLKAFFRNAKYFLKQSGRILMAYANTGFPELLEDLVKDSDFSKNVLKTISRYPEEFYICEMRR